MDSCATGAGPNPAAVPVTFDAAGAWCFGWFHRAAQPARGVGVVLCRPKGYEAMCAYQTYTQLAEVLARSGFDVLRFDYQGTGDSAGADEEPARVRAWIDSTVAAAGELKRLAGVSRLALFGVRLGATLAAHAACEMGGVDSLVMWAPCVTGRAFVRELRAASANRAAHSGQSSGTDDGGIEALGYLYTAQTLQDLQALDCSGLQKAPARRVLLIGRDDMPGEGPLPAAYRAMGIDTTSVMLRGYAGMMAEPHEGVIEHASLESIAEWLAQAHPRPRAAPVERPPHRRYDEALLPEGVREVPVFFGPGESLFGILAEPAEARAAPGRRETAVLMLNVGGNYRIGPNRLYVKMARTLAAGGVRAFRFDLAGLGDSAGGPGPRTHNYFSKDAAVDVRAAIDWLAGQGCTRFYVMGICSGSYVAFQAALADPRVSGQVLMNSRLLEWQEGTDEAAWQATMRLNYKSTAFYRSALMQPGVYRRMLRGEVDVQGIARRVGTVIEARIRRAVGRLANGGREEEGVLARTRQLCARGTDTLVVVSAHDDGRDYLEFHFGNRGSRLAGNPNFRMIVVEGGDHTFSSSASQRMVTQTVQQHIERRLAAAG